MGCRTRVRAVAGNGSWMLTVREGTPEGAADWRQEFGNAANTLASKDRLVKAPLGERTIYGLVYDIAIVDAGLVRQLVTAPQVDPTVIADNRTNRTVPMEISVLAVGYGQEGAISQLLPPRAPWEAISNPLRWRSTTKAR